MVEFVYKVGVFVEVEFGIIGNNGLVEGGVDIIIYIDFD